MIKSDKIDVKEKEDTDNKVDIDVDINEDIDSESVPQEDVESNDNVNLEQEEEQESKDADDALKEKDEEMKKKNKEIESLTDMLKRRQADFENYKKRIAKNQEEHKKLAIKDFAFDIININDDLLRAIDAASNIDDEQTKAFAEGFRIISKRLEETLQKYGIEEIDSLEKEFDPKFNEAVEIDMSEDVDRDTITMVHQKGFRLDDYVVRSAKVKVTKPMIKDNNNDSPKNASNEDEGEENNNQDTEENTD